MADRLVVLTSEPGLGATALLEADVTPVLRSRGCIVLTYRDWQGRNFVTSLKEALATAVREQADETFFSTATEPLAELLRRIYIRTKRPVALLLDQFEEYIRCHAGTHISDSFDAELSNAIATHTGKFIVALQEHGLNAFERFSQYIPNLLGCRVPLAPLPPDAARVAVRAEAERRGMQVEEAVLDALVTSPPVAVTDGVNPFFLMRAATLLLDAESRLGSACVRHSTLQSRGGPERLILESLDAPLGDLSLTQTELLFRWCNILISPEGERLSVTLKALTDYAGKLNRFVPTTMPLLMEKGLLRPVEMPDSTRYEIAHECLTPIVRDWWQRREADLTARRRAKFRVRSLSVAAGCIVALYAAWLLASLK